MRLDAVPDKTRPPGWPAVLRHRERRRGSFGRTIRQASFGGTGLEGSVSIGFRDWPSALRSLHPSCCELKQSSCHVRTPSQSRDSVILWRSGLVCGHGSVLPRPFARRLRYHRPVPEGGTRRRVILAVLAALAAVAVVVAPVLPRGTDVYPHVLWSWQVQRCLAVGSVPVWLPDLNAGFGSPGIRLYSPLGPLLAGALALLLGGVGRGLRAALLLAGVVLLLAARRRGRHGAALLVLLSPVVLFEGGFRFPVSQLLALPLAWELLDRWGYFERQHRERDALLFAVLWLVHAPTALLIAPLVGALALQRPRTVPGLAASWLGAAALSSWHWLPLLAETRGSGFAAALTTGELHPLRNLLGAPDAHLVDHNVALGWAAVGVLAALVIGGGWRSAPGLLATACVFMSSLASAPIWRGLDLLAWLQFPWRLLLPATILTALTLARSPRGRALPAAAALLAPLLFPPPLALVREPQLGRRTTWVEAGRQVAASFEGNPLLVDVAEHRPAWWGEMARTIAHFGRQPALFVAGSGSVQPLAWHPARRAFRVATTGGGDVGVRLLFDAHWAAAVDGQPVPVQRWGAALAVAVPPGVHTVTVKWVADPPLLVGLLLALFGATGLLALHRRGGAPSQQATAPPPP